VQKQWHRPGDPTATGGLLAGLRFHRRAASPARRAFRTRPWQRRACARRVLRHRVRQSQGAGHGRRRAFSRRISLRTRASGLQRRLATVTSREIPTAPSCGLARHLGLFGTTMAVMGGIIGAGIFINPYLVAERVDTSFLILSACIAGGIVALLGGFIYAELATRLPAVGELGIDEAAAKRDDTACHPSRQ